MDSVGEQEENWHDIPPKWLHFRSSPAFIVAVVSLALFTVNETWQSLLRLSLS